MSTQNAFYNEGVGHGGFVAAMSASGNVIIEDFSVDDPSKKINQTNQIGAPRKAAGIEDFMTGTATAAIEVSEGGNPVTNPIIVEKGETFTDPFYGFHWWVEKVGGAFRAGDFWKQTITFQRRYNQ